MISHFPCTFIVDFCIFFLEDSILRIYAHSCYDLNKSVPFNKFDKKSAYPPSRKLNQFRKKDNYLVSSLLFKYISILFSNSSILDSCFTKIVMNTANRNAMKEAIA